MSKENKTKKTNGRPKKEIDFAVLDALVQFKVTKIFVADYMGVSEDTIEKRIKEKTGMTFTDYSKLKQQRTGLKLQQKCIERAIAGDRTLLIFALKNFANWSDKQEQSIDITTGGKSIALDNPEERQKRIKKLHNLLEFPEAL
jgi:hypothetical protein